MKQNNTQIVKGQAFGKAFIIKDNKEIVSNIVVNNPSLEITNFLNAVEVLKKNFRKIIKSNISEEEKEIISSHLAFLEDKYFIEEIKEKINQSYSSIYSVNLIFSKYIDLLLSNNKLEQSRSQDFLDVKRQLINILIDYELDDIPNHPFIIVANEIFPSTISRFRCPNLKGVISKIGGITSHSAIILKSYNIPYITNYDVKKIKPTDNILIGSNKKLVIINPNNKDIKNTKEEKKQKGFSISKHDKIDLFIDCVSRQYLENIKKQSIGLVRSELLYLEFLKKPTFKEEVKLYEDIMQTSSPFSTTIRLFDFSQDKLLPYYNILEEDLNFYNIGIRLFKKYPKLFISQLEAILLAYSRHSEIDLKILLPMVSNKEEVIKIRNVIDEIIKRKGYTFDKSKIKIGIMVEVMITALSIKEYEGLIDFISIGTNDLVKAVFLVSRDDPRFNYKTAYHNPNFLNLLSKIKDDAINIDCDVFVCGVMASSFVNIKKLYEIGFTKFVVSYDKIEAISAKLNEI